MTTTIITLVGPESKSNIVKGVRSGNAHSNAPAFVRSLVTCLGENPTTLVQILNGDSVKASGTLTIAVNTDLSDGDTYQIGTTTITAKSSGATGAQFNIGGSATLSATALAAAINANSSSLISASSALGVVTITASVAGPLGNAIPIIITHTTPGAATTTGSLSGGANDTSVPTTPRGF